MIRVLVNGSTGQLGNELLVLSKSIDLPWLKFDFVGRYEWDICNSKQSQLIIDTYNPDYLIHTAAYTKVDLAEKEEELCYKTNIEAPALLASICANRGIRMVHFSSDYVFCNRPLRIPVQEDAIKSPLGVYAQSKAIAEDKILSINPSAVIIRTSWVYSSFGHNFVKTMLKLAQQHKHLRIVNDQTGSPTYAANLAELVLEIIQHEQLTGDRLTGIFHYCNTGATTWFEFANEIFLQSNITAIEITPVSTFEYGAAAPRPAYSVLNCDKIRNKLNIHIPSWQDSLAVCLDQIRRHA
ncbi:MAG: dTDP-4-dehydrorhamnose reductase [Saprospiraceae bacterium]|nr:dTDP-4-dehydrorhamnose reductase [Saprospiraceae bacterium]HMX87216.1 dTDP-4-dehydrorhamnose reductase [Saprospiraceae bacterium]HMZ38704.1 dTDP-4-dehydrorhamnose reductase [Saprospiraceae bacterium]HNA63914.1 dTDP-4-dehydrorhamnose reductase [Saprospiraceae bacterium]HNB30533.1 dTDP-4-dehydrorhamnose reductase [Saprospiraceae bacterium]